MPGTHSWFVFEISCNRFSRSFKLCRREKPDGTMESADPQMLSEADESAQIGLEMADSLEEKAEDPTKVPNTHVIFPAPNTSNPTGVDILLCSLSMGPLRSVPLFAGTQTFYRWSQLGHERCRYEGVLPGIR